MPSDSLSLLPALQHYIHTQVQVIPQTKIVVAVSGGPDSTALLWGLTTLSQRYEFSLIVAHVNHMLRGDEALRDQEFVRQQAKRLRWPFYQTRVDAKSFQHRSGLSPQHAARQVRYHFLLALHRMLGARYIALGHTADDQTETLLVRLIRGGSPEGLAGIPAMRPPFIRPLMGVSRSIIQTYLQSQRIPWMEDSSNTNRAYLRNSIRLDLLPILRQYNPQIAKRFRVLGTQLQTDQTFLREQVAVWSAKTVHWHCGYLVRIRCDLLRSAPRAIQHRLLAQIVQELLPSHKAVSFQHICGMQRLLTDGQHGQRYTLPGGIWVERQHESLEMWNLRRLPSSDLTFTLPIPGEVTIVGLSLRVVATVCPHPGRCSREGNTADLNLQRLHPPLTIRFPKPGDRFVPLGMHRQKKLHDFFIDRKIRRMERTAIPLVIDQGEIAWVIGHRVSETFKVHLQTTSIVRLRCVVTEGGIL